MRVKELLKEKGMTAKELAARLGMTETGLSIAISDKGKIGRASCMERVFLYV